MVGKPALVRMPLEATSGSGVQTTGEASLYGLRAASRPALRAFFFAHPAIMAVAVTATGNHYFLDSLAGIAVALLALIVVRGSRRLAGQWAGPLTTAGQRA
jgi:hypothetical protein